MAYLKTAGQITGAAARVLPRFVDMDDIAGDVHCTKYFPLFDPDGSKPFWSIDGDDITRVENLANAADPLLQADVGRRPIREWSPELGRYVARCKDDFQSYMNSPEPFAWGNAHTVAALINIPLNASRAFQAIAGQFSAVLPNSAGLVATYNAGTVGTEFRITHRIGSLPGGADAAKFVYLGGDWAFIASGYNGNAAGTKTAYLAANNGAVDAQAITTGPTGVTAFGLGHSGSQSLDGQVALLMGWDINLFDPANADRLADVYAHARMLAASAVPIL